MDDQGAKKAGAWIRASREARGMRQIDLVASSGISQSQLSLMENGKHGPSGWTLQIMNKVEDALEVPRGTLRRVANGEPIQTEPGYPDEVTDELMTRILTTLRGEVTDLRDEVAALRRRVDDLDR